MSEGRFNSLAGPGISRWRTVWRIMAKALLLFVLINLIFAAATPLNVVGRFSIYNWLVPGRERLPYGEQPNKAYNLTLNNLPAMMASHIYSTNRDENEFRVIVLGDSGTWGWLLENYETIAGQITAANMVTGDGRSIVAYNLAYPVMSATKDLVLLELALEADPDLIIWPVTLQSLARANQLDHPLLQENPDVVRKLIDEYGLSLDAADDRFEDRSLVEETIVGRRRDLADLLRLQLYGISWAATGIDQTFPGELTLRRSDFDNDVSWLEISEPITLTSEHITWEVLEAGTEMAGETPLWIVNEPIFISEGQNSDLRYNAWYPRWAYDQYTQTFIEIADRDGWLYLDLWDSIGSDEFSDSPVHLTPSGSAQLTELLIDRLLNQASGTKAD